MINGSVWAAGSGTTQNTEVTALEMKNNCFTFTLSVTDFGSAVNNQSASSYRDYNFWNQIKIYLNGQSSPVTLDYANADGDYTAGENPQKGNTFYNLWTTPNTFAVGSSLRINSAAVKVVIPAGCEFPSYEYTSGAITTRKSFVTTEEIIFVKDGDSWVEYVAPVGVNTSVTAVSVMNDCFVFTLSETDFAGAVNNTSARTFTDYGFWNDIQVYVGGQSEPISLATANADTSTSNPQKGNTFYNLWTNQNTFAVGSATGIHSNAVKIVIPAGTEFPSYAYTSGTVSTKKSYVTAEEIIFVKNGDVWEKQSASGDISDLSPSPSNGEIVNMISGGIYEFVTDYERWSSGSLATKGDCYAPTGVTITWNAIEGAVNYIVNISTKADMSEVDSYTVDGTSLTIDDLYVGEDYYYQITVNFASGVVDSEIYNFKTARLPRTISIDKVSNTRDIGGWLTADGKYQVRQGMAYRGANADSISEKGKEEFLNKYGIKTDLDVRGDHKRSPLGDAVNYVSQVGPMYTQIAHVDYQEALAGEIRTFADPDNYPIYFHCQVGRDRTGTLSFLINSLLGLSEEDLYKEYELSMFSSTGWWDIASEDSADEHFESLVNYIKSYGDGTLKENVELFMLNELGITQDEIDSIRAILLEEVGNVEAEDTTISTIHVRNGKLLVFLDNQDYDNASATQSIGTKLSEYNVLDNILLYKSDTEYAKLSDICTGEGYYNVWGEMGSISFSLKNGWDGTSITKVVFLAGTNFPSYSYTNENANTKTNYVLRQRTEFSTDTPTASNTNWIEKDISKPQKVKLLKVQSGHNAEIVTFYLSKSDYSGLANASIGARHTDYNYLDNIRIYSSDTVYVTLKEAIGHQKYYNMWTKEDTVSIQLTDDVYDTAIRIVIPEGTVFPSYQYTSGATNKKRGYEIREELIYERPQNVTEGSAYDWVCVDTSKPEDVSVMKLLSGHNEQIITFYLSDSDYEAKTIGAAHADYNYLDNIRIYSDETTYQTLGEVYHNQRYYNMWGREDTISLQLTVEAYNKATKIVIPAGTIFPSYAHTNEGSSYLYGYKTVSDISFTRPDDATEGGAGYEWLPLTVTKEIETVVDRLQVRSVSGKLLFFLSEHDYADAKATMPIGNKIQVYNLLKNVVLYKSDTEYTTLADIYGNENYYNIWGENGCVAVDLIDGWDGTNIQKVVIKAGCEFPSYTYTSGATNVRIAYKTKYDIIFTATEQMMDNASYVQSMILPSNPIDTMVENVKIMGSAEDVRLIFMLSVQDYEEALDSTPCLQRFKDYNTMDKVFLYIGNEKIALKNAINEDEVYYNLWGNAGSISYGLKPEYTLDSIVSVMVESGCEFPAYAYTSTTSTDKVAYTTTVQKELEVIAPVYQVNYFGVDGELLYTDSVACGTLLELRAVPEIAGYIGTWSGLKYTVMPAQNISYQLSYEMVDSAESEETEDTDVEDKKDSVQDEKQEDKKSPTTGDAFKGILYMAIALISLAGIAITFVWKKKCCRR